MIEATRSNLLEGQSSQRDRVNGELGIDRGTVRALGVGVRSGIKRASRQPSQINSDKKPKGSLKITDRESDLERADRNRHLQIQAGWIPVQVRSGKHSLVVEPCRMCPCWHWKSTLLPTWPQTDNNTK